MGREWRKRLVQARGGRAANERDTPHFVRGYVEYGGAEPNCIARHAVDLSISLGLFSRVISVLYTLYSTGPDAKPGDCGESECGNRARLGSLCPD